MEKQQNQLVVIAPVKNEEWIIEKFLTACSAWADYIILADQNSTDRTVELAQHFPKVKVVRNSSGQYSEIERSKLMLNAVREIEGPKAVLAIDADEFFTGDIFHSVELQQLYYSPPGTVFKFFRFNFAPGFNGIFNELPMVIGFVDDGRTGMDTTAKSNIHNMRVPFPPDSPGIITFHDIRIMHYDFLDFERAKSKARWYQCFERTVNKKEQIAMFRNYFIPDKVADLKVYTEIRPFHEHERMKWIQPYSDKGIDMTSIRSPLRYWWDPETEEMLRNNTSAGFDVLNIWSYRFPADAYRRPTFIRRAFNLMVRRYLIRTQPKRNTARIRRIDRLFTLIYR